MKVAGFDWDDGNADHCAKHGVSAGEIEHVFQNDPAVYADPKHSLTEQRLRAIGRNREGRYVFIAFALRKKAGETFIRPVSARYMHEKEIRRYEEDAP